MEKRVVLIIVFFYMPAVLLKNCSISMIWNKDLTVGRGGLQGCGHFSFEKYQYLLNYKPLK